MLLNMEKSSVIVQIHPMAPYVMARKKNGSLEVSGCLGELWIQMASILNLSSHYCFRSCPEEPDIVLCGATKWHHNSTHLAFVSSWYDIHLDENQLASAELSYLKNWSSAHWLCTLGMVVLYAITLFIMLKFAKKYHPSRAVLLSNFRPEQRKMEPLPVSWRKQKIDERHQRLHNEWNIVNCIMASIATMTGQGGWVNSYVTSIRILLISFLLFGMIMCSAYSAKLVSQLSLGRDVPKGLANKDQTIICVRNSSLPNVMKEIDLRRYKVSLSCSETICSGYPALETPEMIGITNAPCRVRTLNKRQFNFKLAISVKYRASHQLLHELQLILCVLRERGITSRIHQKWLRRPVILPKHGMGKMHELDFQQIAEMFLCYFLILVLSFFLLLFEIMIYKRKPQK